MTIDLLLLIEDNKKWAFKIELIMSQSKVLHIMLIRTIIADFRIAYSKYESVNF